MKILYQLIVQLNKYMNGILVILVMISDIKWKKNGQLVRPEQDSVNIVFFFDCLDVSERTEVNEIL